MATSIATLMVKIGGTCDRRKRRYEEEKDAFIKSAVDNSMSFAASSRLRDVMEAEFLFRCASELEQLVEYGTSKGYDDARVLQELTNALQRWESRIFTDQMFRSNSTCPIENMKNQIAAQALCKSIVWLREELEEVA